MENYTFNQIKEQLDQGFQIYFTYVRNRYLIFKTAENCYTQKLISVHDKNPQPMIMVVTLKRIKEMFDFMEDIEYKVGISETENLRV